MNTILIDNHNLRDEFFKMLSSQSPGETNRVLYISAQSGKGKSTIIDFFYEYSSNFSAFPIRLDFKFFHISTKLELMETIINQIRSFYSQNIQFVKYQGILKSIALSPEGDTVIQNVEMQQTYVGTVHINRDSSPIKQQIIEEAFFQDLRDFSQSIKAKVVFLFDSFEHAPEDIRHWLYHHWILSKILGDTILLVFAGENTIDISPKYAHEYGVKKYALPDTYDIDDWLEYGKQVNIDAETVNKCFSCYHGEPFHMCISLLPHVKGGKK